ncbi:WD40-repeat-containing domain protein [Cladochytrium replicatum]|nr:WD40-repeat-containing domain protein [Cladochytrium replicatum]
MVTSELRQVQDLLTELTKRRSDLEDELRNIAEREEKVSELLADFESRLSNISEETIRTEKRIRSIKADSTVMEIEAPPEIPPDTCIMTLYGHSDSIECLDFDGAYGTLVTGSADRTVRVWDLSSYRCHAELSGHTGWIRAVQLHRSFVVSGSGDNTLRMWDITRLPPLPNSALTPDMAPSIPYCRLDARREQPLEEDDMKDLVVGEGEGDSLVLRKNDNSTNVCVRVFRGHTGAVSCLQFDDQWLLSGSVDKTIRQWDMPTGKELLCLRSEKWLEADEMSRVDVFLLGETRDPIGFAQGLSFATAALGKPASPIATSPIADSEKTEVDGVVGEAGSESPVPATNGDAGVPPGKLTIQASPVVSIANSSPSFRVENAGGHVGALQYWQHALAAGYGDGVVRLWDLRTGKSHRQLRSTNGHYQPITSLKFDSNYIATGSSDKTIKIWDIRKGDVTDTIRFSHAVNDLHMDPFRIMAATGSRDVYVYNRSSSLTRTLQGHTKAVRSLKCAEEVLISAGMDSCARIWKL